MKRRHTVRLLRVVGQSVVVAIEGEESAELHPTVTELLIRVASKTASIDTKHGNTKECELESLGNAEKHGFPSCIVVATPVTCPLSSTCICATANDEGSFARDRCGKSAR